MPKREVNAISKGRAAKGQREDVSPEWQEHDTLPLSRQTFYQAASDAELARERRKGRNRGRNTFKDGGMVDYDAKMARLDYPGTKGVSMPDAGKQQLTGKGFRGTF